MEKDKAINLEKILFSAFELYKKNSNKKDKKYQIICEIKAKLKESKSIKNYEIIKNYCILSVEPVENPNLKIILKITKTIDNIINYNLVDISILQITIEHYILYLCDNLSKIEFDFDLYNKILIILNKIIENKNVYIHNIIFKSILKILLKMIILSKNNHEFQMIIKNEFNKLTDFIINNIKNSWDFNINVPKHINYYQNYEEVASHSPTKTELFNKILLDEYYFISQKYLNYLIDLIEIQNKLNDNNLEIISKFINIIKTNDNISNYKNEIEKLKLEEYKDLFYNEYPIGKYGWCIYCRKTSNKWDEKINFPICENKNCLNIIYKSISLINTRNDYLNMIICIFLSSSIGVEEKKRRKFK